MSNNLTNNLENKKLTDNFFFNLIDEPSPVFFLIAGPCVIENYETSFSIAQSLKETTEKLGIPFIFKASFDKANRTSIDAFRGPGFEEGLEILNQIKHKLKVPVISDIHLPDQAKKAAQVLDIIQIPAFLCRQTDLILAACATGKPVNIKKGQFLSPFECKNIITKATSSGNHDISITERGACFGYNNLVVDFRSIHILRQMGSPVIFDATHSVQLPGGAANSSAGERQFVPTLSKAAIAAGAHGLFIETHPDPDRALCDGPNSMPLEDMEPLLKTLLAIKRSLDNSMEKHVEKKQAHPESSGLNPDIKPDLELSQIKLLLLDVDGVLTDGQIIYTDSGEQIKSFSSKDGLGLRLLMDNNIGVGIVTGRKSGALGHRLQNLGIDLVFDGIRDKAAAFDKIVAQTGLASRHIAFVGDDLIDLPAMIRAGISFTVPDAPQEVKHHADRVTLARGGHGAVREICESILKAQGLWETLLNRYLS